MKNRLIVFSFFIFGLSCKQLNAQSFTKHPNNPYKWIRIARESYPNDTLRQNTFVFANLFWSDSDNAKVIGKGMTNLLENHLKSNYRSFTGDFSFLVSFDDMSLVKKVSFSKNVPVEFIDVVQNSFKSLFEEISQMTELKGSFKNKKILLKLHLDWTFSNSQSLKEYIDNGINTLEFNDEGSTLGEVLIAPSNFMSRYL